MRTHRSRSSLPVIALTALGLAAAGCSSAAPSLSRGEAGSPVAQVPTPMPAPAPTLQLASQVTVAAPSTIADLVEHVAPTVVNITTTQVVARREGGHPFDFLFPEGPMRGPRQRSGAGTGFVIDGPAGYIVTNAHVVEGADEVKVHFLDRHELAAQVVGRDTKVDLALLKIQSPTQLPSVVLGDSHALRVGEQVLAVGNPFGLGHSVSLGIVSAKARTIGAGPYDDFIQTDASINPGNSGGPLFNLRGEVIGINTAIRAGAEGIGFAIPVDVLKDVLDQLRQKGFVERGKLGLTFQPVTPELAAALGMDRSRGAIVNEVMKDSAAARAGVQSGDVIVEVGGVGIERSEELARNVARHAPGSIVELKVLRQGKPFTVRATLDRLDEGEPQERSPRPGTPDRTNRLFGLEVDEAPGGGARVVGLSKPIDGLMDGDVIVEVAGKAIGSTADLKRELEARRAGERVLVKVRRGGKSHFVGLPVE
ncbi:MAG: trypsin-like peptidase domain-containing protein [Deltaproteobacteria bacterium]|nr:trypsin-like peptidase domain-containing protein [Deltaproteobacteria bacterium]